MKNKLAIFLLSAVMAVSGTVAATSVNNSVKAQDAAPYSDLFTYDASKLTLTANQSAPSYFTSGIVDINGVGHKENVGMGFSATADTTFSLNQPIYIGDNDLSQPIFEFMITPKTPIEQSTTSVPSTAKEFQKLTITLTDVNDPAVYFNISAHFSSTNSTQTWLQVSSPTHTRAGVNKGILTSEDTKAYGQGMGIQSSFTGGNKYMSTLFYDNSETAVYAYRSFYASALENTLINVVRDLNDPAHLLGQDIAFSGFSTGYVNVSFKIEEVTANSANFIIRSIDGQVLNHASGELVDSAPPSISVDANVINNLPKAEVGKFYPFPDTYAFDFVDGEKVTMNVTVKDQNGNVVTNGVTDKGFTPSSSQTYTLEFQAQDNAGNKSSIIEIKVDCYTVLEDFKLTFVDPSQIVYQSPVGANIIVPDVKLVGGSGNNYVKSYIVSVESNEVVSTNLVYTPVTPGWYKIVYEYKDYLSEVCTFTIDVNVLSGKKYFIPSITATDYASFNGVGQVVPAVAEVKVVGLDKDNNPVSEDWKEVTEGYYVPNVVSGTLSLRFKAKPYFGGDYSYTNAYEMAVLNLTTQKELYKFFNTTENVNAENVLVKGIEKQIAFFPENSGESLQFINKLPVSSFGATVNFDDDNLAIKKFKVVLQDSENADEKVTLTYSNRDNLYSNVEVGGIQYSTYGSFISEVKEIGGEFTNVPGSITVKIREGALYDSVGYVAKIPTFDSGVEFTGFSTGKIYFSLIFEEVDADFVQMGKGSSVRFTDFCGTSRFATSGKDNVVPSISLSGDISTYYDLNSYVTLPSAFAVDLFDPDVSVSLTVTDPLGNVLLNKVATDKDHVLHLDKIGQYLIEYVSIDQNKNKGNLQFAVYSADTFDPVLEIAGQFKSTAKITDPYIIHKAIAYDNHDKAEDLIIYVYVFGPDGYIETVAFNEAETEEVEYNFTKVGTYRIRYFVMDSYGNYVHKVFYVTVS